MGNSKKSKDTISKKAQKVKGVLSGFKDFAIRGNALELAVGVVVGGAFSALVNALVNAVINPLIAAIFGKPDMSGIFILTLNGSDIKFGLFFSSVINFIIIAASIYFCIVLPLNKLALTLNKQKDDQKGDNSEKESTEAEPQTPEESLLREIRDLLKKSQPKKNFR